MGEIMGRHEEIEKVMSTLEEWFHLPTPENRAIAAYIFNREVAYKKIISCLIQGGFVRLDPVAVKIPLDTMGTAAPSLCIENDASRNLIITTERLHGTFK